MSAFLRFSADFFRPSLVLNSSDLEVPRTVPPRWIIFATCDLSIRKKSPSISPENPLLIPTTSIPSSCAARYTALIAAFIPGASPPDVRIPIRDDPGIFPFIAGIY